MPSVPREELYRRLGALQRLMATREPPLDAALVLQYADLYYLSGTIQQAHLLVPREGEPRLLVRKVLERAREDSALADLQPLRSLGELPGHLERLCGPRPWRLGLELDVLPVKLYRRYEELLGEGAVLGDVSASILDLRSVKSPWEVEQIRKSGEIHRRLFAELRDLAIEGVTTYALQARLAARACELGHCGIVRLRGLNAEAAIGLAASGEKGAVPSHSLFPIGGAGMHPWSAAGGGPDPIRRDVPVVLDFLMSATGYHADCTRMAVAGRFPPEAAAVYGRLREILRLSEERLRPGVIPEEIYLLATEAAARAGLARGFMGPPGYGAGFVGHGVGLEVNEAPVLAPRFARPLEPGNVVALEPKFTDRRWGVVGLENTYLVTGGDPENLTPLDEGIIQTR